MSDDFFAPPPFDPQAALQSLTRSLRELKPLVQRDPGFEFAARRVVELRIDARTLVAKIAKRPALAPEWETFVMKNNADVRKCVDDMKRRLARWTEE